jgi:putative MATE family efflux protein
LLTAGLDPILMLGWLGVPAMGLNGTAWAALIAQGAALASLVVYLRVRRSLVAPGLGLKGFDWATAWTTVRIGIPSSVQHSMISVSMVFVTGIVNGFGPHATAAFGAASRVDGLAFMPAMTLSLAVSTLTGQNIGAGRPNRVREVFLWGCLFSGGITLAVSILAVSVPQVLLRAFTSDTEVIDLGAGYLRIVGASYVLFAIMFISNGVINGSGRTVVTTAFTLVSLWIVRVPVAYWLSRGLGSIDGVWYAMALSFAVSMLASLAYYSTGRWRTSVVRSLPIPTTPEDVFGEETGEA